MTNQMRTKLVAFRFYPNTCELKLEESIRLKNPDEIFRPPIDTSGSLKSRLQKIVNDKYGCIPSDSFIKFNARISTQFFSDDEDALIAGMLHREYRDDPTWDNLRFNASICLRCLVELFEEKDLSDWMPYGHNQTEVTLQLYDITVHNLED